MWSEKALLPHVVKFLATKDGFSATTLELKNHLSNKLTLDDRDKSYTSSVRSGLKTNRFIKTVGNFISHDQLTKSGFGKTIKGKRGMTKVVLDEKVGEVVNLVSESI